MKKILLVEDDERLRSALADTLVSEGYAVTETTDGAAAKGIMSIKEFDLIIVDMKMPHVTGGELFEWAKNRFPTPFIIISGYNEEIDIYKSKTLDVFQYISKPFKAKDLIEAVKKTFCNFDQLNTYTDNVLGKGNV